MSEQETNTAADRLFRIANGVFRQDGNMLNIWSNVLDVPSKDKLEVFRRILSVAALVDEIENTVRQQGDRGSKLYLRALDQVRRCLIINVEGHRNHLNEFLTQGVVTDLEHCAARYSELDREIPVPNEDVGNIKTRVNELFEDISKS